MCLKPKLDNLFELKMKWSFYSYVLNGSLTFWVLMEIPRALKCHAGKTLGWSYDHIRYVQCLRCIYLQNWKNQTLFFKCICSDSLLFIDTLIFYEKGYFKIKTSPFIYQMRCYVQKRQEIRRKGENMRHPQSWDSPCWAQIIMDIGLRLAFLSCFSSINVVIINQSSSNWDNWICCPIHMVS